MSDYDPFDIADDSDTSVDLVARTEIDDLKWLMSSKRGRRIAYRMLEKAGVWRLSFNTNALTMAFNEGRKNEGLSLLANITTHCPDRYSEMMKEISND